MHIIAAKAVCFKEARSDDFKKYQEQVVKNAAALADGLKNYGFDLVSDGTDNHLILVDLRNFNITGKEMEKRLDDVRITANKNAIPFDPEKPFVTSGIRLGTPAVTTRGFKEEDAAKVAELIVKALQAKENEAELAEVKAGVRELTEKYPLYNK